MNRFLEKDQNDVNIVDFVNIFLQVMEHEKEETFYLTLGLIDIFKEISYIRNRNGLIQLADITNYISEVNIFIL